MPAIAPPVIHVKRKRTEDGPVPFLRIEKRARNGPGGGDIFYRKREVGPDVERDAIAPPAPLRPVVHASRPGDENLPLEQVKAAVSTRQHPVVNGLAAERTAMLPMGQAAEPERALKAGAEPRRFHLSRSSTPSTPPVLGGISGVKKRSSRSRFSSPAVFVERGRKKRLARAGGKQAPPPPPVVTAHDDSAAVADKRASNTSVSDGMDVDGGKAAQTLPKRPASKRVLSVTTPSPAAKTATPMLLKAMVNKASTKDMNELARQMHEYTMQTISQDVATKESQVPTKEAAAPQMQKHSTMSSEPSKFKPKAPAQRYAERHPEVAMQETPDKDDHDAMDMDMDGSDSDDDYVTETYVRMAGPVLDVLMAPDQVGVLVLDTDPDANFFYGEESDSEEEMEDEDDENAENYYAADYPDEELASDDEYDRDPYNYRTKNASDLEEYSDDGDEGYSGDEGQGPAKYQITIGNQPGPLQFGA